jgi:hypothetical protein
VVLEVQEQELEQMELLLFLAQYHLQVAVVVLTTVGQILPVQQVVLVVVADMLVQQVGQEILLLQAHLKVIMVVLLLLVYQVAVVVVVLELLGKVQLQVLPEMVAMV